MISDMDQTDPDIPITPPRFELLTEGIFVWTIDHDAEWAYSKFPSALITVDYGSDDLPITIVAIGREAKVIEREVADLLADRLYELDLKDAGDKVYSQAHA